MVNVSSILTMSAMNISTAIYNELHLIDELESNFLIIEKSKNRREELTKALNELEMIGEIGNSIIKYNHLNELITKYKLKL